jgi:ADP-ribosylglycohydrolase
MALCLATSLVERGGFDADDQMRRYCRWMDEGYLSSAGVCFDIGTTVASALRGEPRDSILFADAEAVLMAANLGDDADTTAAVCEQVAGAYYGEQGIPTRWLEPLVLRKEIAQLADALPAGGG